MQYIEIIQNYQQIIKDLESQVTELSSENNKLKKILNNQLDNQQLRVELITEIAKYERKNLYNDIINIMSNINRFNLDNLLKYSAFEWLSKQNPVIVKFIETLIYNKNENKLEGKKLFKCAIAIDTIYDARHLKYVSAINLTASVIKYLLTRSKKVINIDNHITSEGGYSYF